MLISDMLYRGPYTILEWKSDSWRRLYMNEDGEVYACYTVPFKAIGDRFVQTGYNGDENAEIPPPKIK